MNEQRLISGRDFFRRLTVYFGITSTIAVFGIASYLYSVVSLSSAEWTGFLEILAFAAPILFGGTTLLNRRLHTPITRFLDAEARGQGTQDGLRAAFRALTDLPYRFFLSGLFWWTAAGVAVGLLMAARFETFGLFRALVIVVAASSGGYVSSVFIFFGLKRLYVDLRSELVRRIGDPDERRALVRRIDVGRKLRWSVAGVTLVTVAFALFLSFIHVSESLEANAVRIQERFLAARADALRADPSAVGLIAAEAREFGIASEVLLIDPETHELVAGGVGLPDAEIAAIEGAAGTSVHLNSPHAFAWKSLGEGLPIAVAVQPWAQIAPPASASWTRFGFTLLVALGIGLALAAELSRDLGATIRELGRSAERVASGDLRRGETSETEDELGELSRSFEKMAGALRATVARVAQTADRVEAAAAETATVSESVASAAEGQAQGVVETAQAMEGVTAEASGISSSAHALNELVEDASSSIMELGASGEQLAETATVLFTKVDEVSSSIQEGAQSMRDVSTNTVALATAAEDTSSSMVEMASALKEVSGAAEDSAERSQRVVETAERGRTMVRQTVESMESIRHTTDAAEVVVRGLGEHAREIGSIVDVIGEVADETNLLALNAAIIAAQAGEHGRAFGVVAEEIKQLANRVLSSTKEIGDLIRGVQGQSENAVEAIAAGAVSVAEGVRLSNEADASLEEITQVSRESGERITQILGGVQEQARASNYVVELMDSVKQGVDAIQRASREQDRGNEAIVRSTDGMRDVAQQLQATTTEQARGSLRIRESIEGVRDATTAINAALQSQSRSCQKVGGFLQELTSKGESNEESARRTEEVTRQLLEHANALRDGIERFRL